MGEESDRSAWKIASWWNVFLRSDSDHADIFILFNREEFEYRITVFDFMSSFYLRSWRVQKAVEFDGMMIDKGIIGNIGNAFLLIL